MPLVCSVENKGRYLVRASKNALRLEQLLANRKIGGHGFGSRFLFLICFTLSLFLIVLKQIPCGGATLVIFLEKNGCLAVPLGAN